MNMLFIPHVPRRDLINRVYEFASNSSSYALSWEMRNSSLQEKILSQIKSLSFEIDDKIVKIPLLFKPESFAPKINTKVLNFAVDRLGVNAVINANALLFDAKTTKKPLFYDLVDDHLEVNETIGLNRKRVEKIKDDIRASRGVICVTEALKEKVESLNLNGNVIAVENGLYIERFKRAKSLKKELGLEGKRVFGYIGGVERWTGLDRACEAFRVSRRVDDVMIVVGASSGEFYQNLKREYGGEIIFVGAVSPKDVASYFKTLDIGLIPFELNDFTNNAFPIKALEYGLAGARVISTPLSYLQKKAFPFIEFAEIEKFE